MTKTVAVVIVTWNSWPVLERCLQALAAQTYKDFSVTIIDNASQSDPPEHLLAAHSTACLVRNPSNTGFAAANNLAVAHHTGDSPWVALLNPDAFPRPDWLAQLMQATLDQPEYAVFASRQLNSAEPDLLDGDGDQYHVSGRASRSGYGLPLAQYQTSQPKKLNQSSSELSSLRGVFSPCGAAALYRRSAYLEVGGLDEDFFCYFEDVDLGFRLQLAGYPCLLVTQAVVHHVGSASTGGQHGDFAVYHGHRNMLWTFVKNMPGLLFWLLLPLHIALNIAAIAYFCVKGRSRLILRSKRDAVLGIPGMWRKRKEIQISRVASVITIWRSLTKTI